MQTAMNNTVLRQWQRQLVNHLEKLRLHHEVYEMSGETDLIHASHQRIEKVKKVLLSIKRSLARKSQVYRFTKRMIEGKVPFTN